MSEPLSFEQVSEQVSRWPLADKVRLLEKLAPEIARAVRQDQGPRISLRGLWTGTTVSDEDIQEVREEMWRNFPRDDV